jgi:tetratricopeptide (TPR) repeat protein
VLYGNSIKNQYALDDEYVVNNDLVKQGISAIPTIFTSYYSGNEKEQYGYRPIARSIFAIEYQVFGENKKAFHIINILLYILLCWLLYSTFSLFRESIPLMTIIVASLLFLFHPVHTEVVNSLKNSEELWCFIFSLLALRFFVSYHLRKNFLNIFAGGTMLYIAFLTKETAFVFFLIIPLFLYFLGARKWFVFLSGLTSFVFLFLAYKTSGWILPEAVSHVENWQNPLFADGSLSSKIILTLLSLGHYSWLLLFPNKLLFYYGFNMIPMEGFFTFPVIISLLVHLFLLVLAVITFKKNKAISMGILFYFLAISLFANYFIPITGIVADRLVFTASWGYCLFLSALLYFLSNQRALSKWVTFFILGILVLYGGRTISRNADWKNIETLYKADIPYLNQSAKANDLYASYMLQKAESLIKNGRKAFEVKDIIDESLKHFKKVTEIFPGYDNAWNNLGSMYLLYYGDTANGVYAFNKALEANPDIILARHNLAYIYYKSGKLEQAKTALNTVLMKDSMYIPSLFTYGEIMTLEQRYPEAENYFKKILRQDSMHTAALFNMGSIYILRQDTVKALSFFEKAIQKDKSNKALIMTISEYYFRKGDEKKSQYYRSLSGK